MQRIIMFQFIELWIFMLGLYGSYRLTKPFNHTRKTRILPRTRRSVVGNRCPKKGKIFIILFRAPGSRPGVLVKGEGRKFIGFPLGLPAFNSADVTRMRTLSTF